MVTHVPIDGATAAWARKRCSLTVGQASLRLKCKPEHIQAIESNDAQPSAGLFRRMADIYMLPEATLLGIAPADDNALPKDFRSFNSKPVKLDYATVRAIRKVQDRQMALARLAAVDDDVLPPDLPIHGIDESPEKLGRQFRQKLGFSVVDQMRLQPGKAFTLWRIIVENLGIAVYVEPLGEEDDSRGVSIMLNEFPAMIINQNEKSEGARSFTLLHELAHILIRKPGISNFGSGAVEVFCNGFAAAFLLPRQAMEAVFQMPERGTIHPSIAEVEFAAKQLCSTIHQVARRL